ncbi:hypothetical protein, partial [Bacteroides heparinolyticus]|uniref:hypothetical protein n=2 Tax=Prevotella heparinolytica TaxID=28113 RepID=UPI00359FB332
LCNQNETKDRLSSDNAQTAFFLMSLDKGAKEIHFALQTSFRLTELFQRCVRRLNLVAQSSYSQHIAKPSLSAVTEMKPPKGYL